MPITKKNILFLNEPIKILIMLHCVPRIKHTSILEVKWRVLSSILIRMILSLGLLPCSYNMISEFLQEIGCRMAGPVRKNIFFQFCFVQFFVPYIAIHVRCKFSSWSIFFKCYWFSPFNRITVMVLSYFKEYI